MRVDTFVKGKLVIFNDIIDKIGYVYNFICINNERYNINYEMMFIGEF